MVKPRKSFKNPQTLKKYSENSLKTLKYYFGKYSFKAKESIKGGIEEQKKTDIESKK